MRSRRFYVRYKNVQNIFSTFALSIFFYFSIVWFKNRCLCVERTFFGLFKQSVYSFEPGRTMAQNKCERLLTPRNDISPVGARAIAGCLPTGARIPHTAECIGRVGGPRGRPTATVASFPAFEKDFHSSFKIDCV